AVDDRNDVRARLPLNIQNHRGLAVRPRRLPHVFGAVKNFSYVRQAHRRAVAIRHNEWPVAVARNQLVVRANRVRLMRPVKRALTLAPPPPCPPRSQNLGAPPHPKPPPRDSPEPAPPAAARR